MANVMTIQGRQVGEGDLDLIGGLLAAHPGWNRTRLSRELCARWDWRNAQGRPKDMAACTLPLKLERAGYLRLPARRAPSPNAERNRSIAPVAPPDEPIHGALRDLQPVRVGIVTPGSDDARLFHGLPAHEHHLIEAPVKDVYLYALVKNFRKALCGPPAPEPKGLSACGHAQAGRAGR